MRCIQLEPGPPPPYIGPTLWTTGTSPHLRAPGRKCSLVNPSEYKGKDGDLCAGALLGASAIRKECTAGCRRSGTEKQLVWTPESIPPGTLKLESLSEMSHIKARNTAFGALRNQSLGMDAIRKKVDFLEPGSFLQPEAQLS